MKLRVATVIVSVLTLIFMACETKIPINEMIKAKQAIDMAMSVNAEQYSPDEMKQANDELARAHDVILKDEKPEEAAKNADVAYTRAMEAYNKSAVLYASDCLKKADEAIAAADAVYAEKLSPDNYSQARDFYNSANEKFENKDYMQAYSLADESYKKAVKAKEESLDNREQLKVKIDEVNSTLAKLAKYDYNVYAAEKYKLAREKANQASDEYNREAIKSGFESVEVAKINADEAYRLTMDGTAAQKITEAEKAVSDAEKSEGASYAQEDLAAAKEALENAKRYKNSGNYNESITYSNEAVRLSNNVIEEGNKAIAARVKSQAEKGTADKTAAEKGTADKGAADGDAASGKAVADKQKAGGLEEDEDYYYYKVKTWQKDEECLSKISEKYYKNAKRWSRILKANKDLIKDPDLIQPDWIIKIPKIKK